MRRLAASTAAFAITLAALVWLAVALRWDEARELGRQSFDHRALVASIGSQSASFKRLVLPWEGKTPQVIWLGDSTLYGTDRAESYAHRIRRQLQRYVDMEVVAFLGSGFWEDYFVAGRLVELDPALVILVANLRCIPAAAHVSNYRDLASMIPTDELPTAMRLPLHEIGMSLPRLLLLRALRVPALEELTWFATGLRREIASYAQGLPLYEPTVDLARNQDQLFAWYAEPVHEGEGSLQAMQAAIALLSRHDIATLVVVTPIPVDALREAGLYREDEVRASVGVVRQLAEAAGASVLDLHDRLPASGFVDRLGHLSTEGANEMARAAVPSILEILEGRGIEVPRRLRQQLVPPAR